MINLRKKHMAVLMVLTLAALIGLGGVIGCDEGGSSSSSSGGGIPGPVPGSVCTEDGGYVSGTSDTELKYPCNISAPTGATTLCGGYTNVLSQMRWLANDLAEEGFIVLSFTPTNNLGLVSGWRTAHKNCISKLQDINANHSTLRGKIDQMSISGYSKGGGGALWASSELGNTVSTTVAMAPYQEGFSDWTLNSVTAATLVQAGSSDTLATSSMTRGQYDGVGASEKCYQTYSGTHLLWTSGTSQGSSDHIQWLKYYMYGIGSSPCTGSGGCN